jgi:general secretion pathway protein C
MLTDCHRHLRGANNYERFVSGIDLALRVLSRSARSMSKLLNTLFVCLVAFFGVQIVLLTLQAAREDAPLAVPAPAPRTTTNEAVQCAPSVTASKLAELIDVPLSDVREKDSSVAAVRSRLRFKLLGTLISKDPEWSMASLQDEALNRSVTVMPGSRLGLAEVLTIERWKVTVLNEGQREVIDMSAIETSQPTPTSTLPTAARQANAPSSGVTKLDDNSYEISRTTIDRALSNTAQVMMSVRSSPSFKNGAFVGFKLQSIRPDSLLNDIGIQNGDVIQRINGFEISTPQRALELYSTFQNASRVDIELERAGQTIRKSYRIH